MTRRMKNVAFAYSYCTTVDHTYKVGKSTYIEALSKTIACKYWLHGLA